MSTPGLMPWQRCNPRSYVVGRDLVELEDGLCQRFAGELGQWSLSDELGATALGLVALLSVFRGLRRSGNGCGLQAPVELLAAKLGKSERMTQYAIAKLQEIGWVRRHKRRVKVDWVDSQGRRHIEADVHAVLYLTPKAYTRVSRRGETRQLVVHDGSRKRVLVAAGAVGNLLKTLSAKLRVLARRVTDAVERCTPPQGEKTQHFFNRRTSGPVGPRPVFGTGPPPLVAAELVAATRHAGLLVERSQLETLHRLWSEGRLTIARAWPDMVKNSDARRRAWLQQQLERLVRVFSAAELRSLASGAARPSAR